MRLPSNTAMENLVPPTSIASVRFSCMSCQNLLGRCRAGSFLHDRDGSHQVTEACCLFGRACHAPRQRRARREAVARAADIHGVRDGPVGQAPLRSAFGIPNREAKLTRLCRAVASTKSRTTQ